MKLPESIPEPEDREERTAELTGTDADMDEAEVGSAGNGADPFGADFTGGYPRPIEDEPDEQDIVPDHIERFPGPPPPDVELTAQPDEEPSVDPSDLP